MSLRVSTLPAAARSASPSARRAASWTLVSNQVRALPSSVATPLLVTLRVLAVPLKKHVAAAGQADVVVAGAPLMVIGTASAAAP